MKYAIATVLILTSAMTTAALAQDGSGHGPPKKASIVFVSQSNAATHSATLSDYFKPKSVLASMAK